jgi:hypothetical protein
MHPFLDLSLEFHPSCIQYQRGAGQHLQCLKKVQDLHRRNLHNSMWRYVTSACLSITFTHSSLFSFKNYPFSDQQVLTWSASPSSRKRAFTMRRFCSRLWHITSSFRQYGSCSYMALLNPRAGIVWINSISVTRLSSSCGETLQIKTKCVNISCNGASEGRLCQIP